MKDLGNLNGKHKHMRSTIQGFKEDHKFGKLGQSIKLVLIFVICEAIVCCVVQKFQEAGVLAITF